MGEIDTSFVVKRFYTLAAIQHLFIDPSSKELSPQTFLSKISKNKAKLKSKKYPKLTLENIVIDQIENKLYLKDNEFGHSSIKKMGRQIRHMEQFYYFSNKNQDKENIFYDTYPIFIAGTSIATPYSNEKLGLDPYSNLHLFSTIFIESMNSLGFDREFVEKLRLVYVQPEVWIQKPIFTDKGFGLQEVLKSQIEKINDDASGNVKYGSMEKFDDVSPKVGNSWFKPELLSKKELEKKYSLAPDMFAENYDPVKFNPEFALERMKLEVEASLEVMSLTFGNIIDNVHDYCFDNFSRLGFNGIPIHMEKTSSSFEIMQRAVNKASSKLLNPVNGKPRLKNTGGEYGPLNGLDMPKLGICEPRAMGRLFGMIDNMHMQYTKKFKRKSLQISIKKPDNLIEFVSLPKYPWMLLEKGTENKWPNGHALIDYLFKKPNDYDLGKIHLELIDRFSYTHRIGWSRKEPRLAIIFGNNKSIYDGFRKDNKENVRWFPEFKDKKILTPDKLKDNITSGIDIFELDEVPGRDISVISDFRGSELSLPTSPKFSNQYFDELFEGNAYVGCTLEKIIGTIPIETRNALIKKALNYIGDFTKDNFLKYRDSDSFNSIFAMRGTAIHALTTEPYPDLVHYQTLEKAGIEPVSSDNYSETTFATKFKFPGKHSMQEFSVSLHPDVYLFLKKGENTFDLFINDTKTNRVTHYPEHKYMAQLFFYHFTIKSVVEKNMGIKIENLYASLDKNAFYYGFQGKGSFVIPHNEHRPMQTSPIIRFDKDHIFHKGIQHLVGQIMEEKEMLRTDIKEFIEYKTYQHDVCHSCTKCYDEHKFVCDYLNRKAVAGIDIKPALSNKATLNDVEHLI
ncbi:hypothetical protein K9L97_01120 [Candidatus Woesearchaeota archaeon]|nr:hypothetical protein [Candidatus Woesearchaeota archaeon]